jgi:ribonuclease G
MGHTLLVNTTPEERRVALLEGTTLRELHTERRYGRGLVGNLYKGRIVRILPGMDAAFVEIGIGRAAFLQAGDALLPRDSVPEDTNPVSDGDASDRVTVETLPVKATRAGEGLAVGQDVLVQVTRDGFGSKAPRLTTQISLAGRNLVYFPGVPILGVSRRIVDEVERARLREAVAGMLPKGAGVILRTVALGLPETDLVEDLGFLQALWNRIETFAADREVPALIHEDLDVLLRTARDLLTEGCDRMIVDTDEDHDRLLQFVDSFMPQLVHRVERYLDEEPIFERYGVEVAASRLLERVVWLKSGGSIVIDHTEALTAIDVNTSRSAGQGDPEDTVLATNLEAAREIAYQLRLRNIGGIVVVDFIDMHEPENRRRVHDALVQELQGDRAHTDVLPMSRLGLVELTRKRSREGVFHRMTDPCPYCEGRGWVHTIEQVSGEILRRLGRELALPQVRAVTVMAHPRVVESLIDTFRTSLADLESRRGKPVRFQRRDDFHLEAYKLRRE